ncbi:MAG: hypothetical protein RSA87_04170 [Malacoplasma sp.]
MNKNKNIQNSNGNNKPWYKKKSTIITSSSVLGVGVLATAIAVPIVLTSTSTATTVVSPEVIATNKILNQINNKDSRIGLWNNYMSWISTTETQRATSLDLIVRKEEFIKQFVSFLIDNLYVTENGTETGSITQVDANKIKSSLLEFANKESFADPALATYTNLFNFTNNDLMLNFRNKASAATIEFSFYMPLAGLDLIYNDNQTVSVKTSKSHDTTKANNIRLSIKTFSELNISSNNQKDYFFKSDSVIELPSAILTWFPKFFETEIKKETTLRKHIETTLSTIKTAIVNDTSGIKSLSYWNSFALLYDKANVAFLKADLLKDVNASGMYKFLTENAKDASNATVPLTELEAIKTIANTIGSGTDAAKGDLLGLTTPFVTSPSYSNLLLNTTNTTGNKYTLELNVTKFNYDFVVNNLFEGLNGIVIVPNLQLSGKLTKLPTGSETATVYNIADASYDVSNLVSMSHNSDLAAGGLVGFFNELTDMGNNETANLINGLVALNSKTIDEQIAFWNAFSSDTLSSSQLITILKAPNTLSNFINQYVDTSNLFGFFASGGALPTIVPATLKASIESARSQIEVTNLNFTSNGSSTITLQPANGIVYGTNAANDKFESITIYFGYEANSLSDINVTSKLTGGSNVSFSQAIGETTGLTDENKVIAAASKRVSIVFKKITTGSSNTSTSIAYFGQSKTSDSPAKQTTKPIIISDRILRASTQFIQAIKAVK